MAACNAHYYATRDPFGPAGDFVTAPEVSQMFGELIGLALADCWARAGRPDIAWVELGPGRGTLSRDALRAASRAGLAPPIHLVETSPVLRAAQARVLPGAVWHDDVATLPTDRPVLIVANEFFDALPVKQWVRDSGGWAERCVDWDDAAFHPVVSSPPSFPSHPREGGDPPDPYGGPSPSSDTPRFAVDSCLRGNDEAAEDGALFEASPAGLAIMEMLARRLATQGGAMLAIDYGHTRTAPGDTLQAVARHRYASPWERPGERDLTAHVDFAALAAAAAAGGAATHGPVEQGAFLTAIGLAQRAAALARAAPDRTGDITAAYRRLSHPDEMGRLFKVLGATGGGWPAPAGFPGGV